MAKVEVWRFTVRDTDDLQATLTLGPVNRDGQTLALELGLRMTLPMPDQDEHLPDRIEACVHRAGLEVQRRLFRALVEKADQELVLVWRFTVRDTDDLRATLTLGPVNRDGQTLALELGLRMTLPMPDQDEHLPDRIEACVHRAGLEV